MKIELQEISLEFHNESLLYKLNLNFAPSKLNCLLGISGSGKTSILKIIAGISPEFQGKVIFNGVDVTNLDPASRKVGWVPQQQLLFPGLSVRKNIEYGLHAQNVGISERRKVSNHLANLIGLEKLLNRSISKLSGGEKQRVALARAIAPNPEILLLDEPFSSLDAPERIRLILLFRDVQVDLGITSILVTHSQQEAAMMSDKVFILANGKIIQEGMFNELQENPKSFEIARILGVSNVLEINQFNNNNKPIIIPESAISIGQGIYDGRIISSTKDTHFLSIEGGIHLRVHNLSGQIQTIGSKVKFSVDDQLIKELPN